MTTFALPTSPGRVTLKQGGGGRAMRALIEKIFIRDMAELPFDGVGVGAMDDGAAFRLGDQWLVMTTDSHVVQPTFFPGGDIGRLSICGTVNDLAMMGATRVVGLTCGVVLEEGYPIESLTGGLSTGALFAGLGAQAAWTLAGYGLVRVVWRRALRRFTSVGN